MFYGRYQVDLRFCFPDACDYMVGLAGNNDFHGFLGHVLYPFRLKLSQKGLLLKHTLDETRFGITTPRRLDLLLSKDRLITSKNILKKL